jgi:TatA/E family protein of Tat protein translocase
MPFGLGFGETILILAVILLFFGPKRLPEAASSLGKGIREFKRSMSGITDELTRPVDTAPAPLPPHSTYVGTGADPYAVPAEPYAPPAPPALPVAEAADAAREAPAAPSHPDDRPAA